MYSKMLIPLDGSKTAEKVLPYARFLAGRFKMPVEFLAVIDTGELDAQISINKGPFLDTLVDESVRSAQEYLQRIAETFDGANVKSTVAKGRVAEVIIDKGEADQGMLIAMATHGRFGVDRWLLGSVAEKVLRGTANPLLLIRATGPFKSEGEVSLKSIIVPLDGSELAESVLPLVAEVAKKLELAVSLCRVYNVPYSVYGYGYGYYAIDVDQLMAEMRRDARDYLEKKATELKKLGVEKAVCVTKEGQTADEIIKFGRETSDGFIVMCSHGRSGVQRWTLGSVTETVVRHSDNPVLILRAARPGE
jgi:nucleotide-binding universal stress UspA family protein